MSVGPHDPAFLARHPLRLSPSLTRLSHSSLLPAELAPEFGREILKSNVKQLKISFMPQGPLQDDINLAIRNIASAPTLTSLVTRPFVPDVFRSVAANPSLTSLQYSLWPEALQPGWGAILARSPSLQELSMKAPDPISPDLVSPAHVRTLTSLTLRITHPTQLSTEDFTAITSMSSLHSLRLDNLSSLHHTHATLLARLVSLEELHLSGLRLRLSSRVTAAIATIPSLRTFLLECPLPILALRSLLTHPTLHTLHITSVDISPSNEWSSEPNTRTGRVERDICNNTTLLSFSVGLPEFCPPAIPAQLLSRICTRNRRQLHQWQCITLLLASYRANRASRIRDSILSLLPDITQFLVEDDMQVWRWGTYS